MPRLLGSSKRGQDLIYMMSCLNSVQDVHELGDKNEQFKLILRLIFRVENFPTRSKVHTGEDTKSKREKN